jgi:hypothetical protein
MIIFFVFTRILDTYSTLLSARTYGTDLELNPLTRMALEGDYFIEWQIIITLVVIATLSVFPLRPIKIGVVLFSVLSLLVSLSNLSSYLISLGHL